MLVRRDDVLADRRRDRARFIDLGTLLLAVGGSGTVLRPAVAMRRCTSWFDARWRATRRALARVRAGRTHRALVAVIGADVEERRGGGQDSRRRGVAALRSRRGDRTMTLARGVFGWQDVGCWVAR